MSFYDSLRHFADSYGLVVLVIIFITLCAWPFLPGSKARNSAAATSIFKDDNDGE